MAFIIGTENADIMLIGSDANDYVEGGDANDTLLGLGGHDTLLGGSGDDVIYAHAGDSIDGGAGRDVLYMADDTPVSLAIDTARIEYVAAGFGNDTIIGAGQTQAVEVYASGGDDSVSGGSGNDALWGSVGNDTLVGNAGDDVLVGDLGADSLSGGAGNDRMYIDSQDSFDGGDGFDAAYIIGGTGMAINLAATHMEWVTDFVAGNDTLDASGTTTGVELYAGGGNDLLTGGSGADLIFAGEGADTLIGGDGDDGLIGEAGADSISGGLGNDRIYADTTDTVDGGDGYDIMYMVTDAAFTVDLGAIHVEWLFAGAGNDSVSSSTAAPIQVYGNAGDDTLSGSSGNDTLWGGAGDDWFQGSWGNDTISGAGGTNTLDYGTVGGAVQVMLTGAGAGVTIKARGADVFTNISVIQGSYGADHLQGWAGATKTVYLRGGIGADTIDGAGNVNNVADYADSSKVMIDLAHGVVTGAIESDTLVNVVAVRGSYGSDTVKGADNGDFSIDGGGDQAGLDTLDYSGLSGPVTVIYGRAAVSSPLGGTVSKLGGNDTFVNVDQVLGTSGDDDLIGTPDPTAASAIRLHGEAGNDYIDGARSTANIADYTDSPGAVVVHLQDYVSGSNTFGDASDGWGGTDTLINVRGVYGSTYADSIVGSDQSDVIQGWYGNDDLDGGDGKDTALYWCNKAQATWTQNGDGSWTVISPYGTDTLRNIEVLQFRNGSIDWTLI